MIGVLISALSLLLMAGFPREADSSTAQAREDILGYLNSKGHNRLVRPDGAGGGGTPVVVNISFTLNRVVDMDEELGLLKTIGYLSISWVDPRLSYQLTFRGRPHNVSSVRMDPSLIWTPDIELYTSDSPGLKSLSKQYLALARPNGQLTWVPQVAYDSFCEPMTPPGHSGPPAFSCLLRFGSWTYSGNDVDLQVQEKHDLSWESSNPRWRMASSSVRLVENRYDCCPQAYVTADYTFQLFRQ